jgi:hypothetical protein
VSFGTHFLLAALFWSPLWQTVGRYTWRPPTGPHRRWSASPGLVPGYARTQSSGNGPRHCEPWRGAASPPDSASSRPSMRPGTPVPPLLTDNDTCYHSMFSNEAGRALSLCVLFQWAQHCSLLQGVQICSAVVLDTGYGLDEWTGWKQKCSGDGA